MPHANRQIVLAGRPDGAPTAAHFKMVEGPVPEPGPGQVLVRHQWLSLDPYMRGRMSAARSYAKPVEVGGVMVGGTVGWVETSQADGFAPGDLVLGYGGWQDYSVARPAELRRLDPAVAPPQTALGILGMPGMTAYTGLLEIGKPKAGETVVVAAATGPVGSLVGQIAKLKGCRAVGIAGGADKCRALTDEFGFDAAVDHRAEDFPARLAAVCPNGIDVYFENVGGRVWDAVAPLFNDFARIPVCGLVSLYNATTLPDGPDRTPQLMRAVLTRRLTIRGFIVWDFAAMEADFLRDVSGWLKDGAVRYREDIAEGLETAPDRFIGMLEGHNFGKALVRIVPE